MFRRLFASTFFFVIAPIPFAPADVRLESGGDYFAVGSRYTVDIYCYSPAEQGRWMGSEWCDTISVRPGDFDRVIGAIDARMDTAVVSFGRSKITLKYDGARGISDRFRVLDVVPEGTSSVSVQLIGKNESGQRTVLDQATLPAHAEFKITQGWNQTYPYWPRPGDLCSFRPPREQVCNTCMPPRAGITAQR